MSRGKSSASNAPRNASRASVATISLGARPFAAPALRAGRRRSCRGSACSKAPWRSRARRSRADSASAPCPGRRRAPARSSCRSDSANERCRNVTPSRCTPAVAVNGMFFSRALIASTAGAPIWSSSFKSWPPPMSSSKNLRPSSIATSVALCSWLKPQRPVTRLPMLSRYSPSAGK